MSCKNCESVIKAAAQKSAGAALAAAAVPSPVLVGRFNDATASTLRAVKDSWACPACQRDAEQKLPLFPDLDS